MTQYQNGYEGARPVSDSGAKMRLAANTELSWTVPGTKKDKFKASFGYASSATVWVGYNVTAAVPGAGTIADSYKLEFKPDAWFVVGGDVLSFISLAGAEVGVSLLQIPN